MNKIITVHYSCMDSLKEGITEKANVWGAENLTTAEKSVCLQVLWSQSYFQEETFTTYSIWAFTLEPWR